MTVKVLFIGDPHIKVSNLVEIELLIQGLEKICSEQNPDLIVIAGDMLDDHEKIWTQALNKAYNMIDILREFADLYILVGNHDYISNIQFLSENHWMNAIKKWDKVTIVDKVLHKTIKNELFVFTPYVTNGRFIEALNTGTVNWRDASCIFAHQEFFGCKMGAITSVSGDTWDETYPFVISGHIHSKQYVQHNIYYPGSALQIAFGESEKNVIPLITFENKTNNIEEIDLMLPRKKIVYVDFDKVDKIVIDDNTKDSLKYTIKGEQEDFKIFKKSKKYKEIIKSGAKITFKSDKKKESKQQEFIDSIDGNDFKTILKELVMKENNKYLETLFNTLIVKD
jgi:DNA repair exonuclease SbcCD nuclease subunit